MLIELHLKNVAVVAEASLELGPGLVVLTGETGAGKSIVVDALALLAGARATSEIIRSGAESLMVTGVFRPRGIAWKLALEPLGLEPHGDEVVLRREISRSGRNRVFVDDVPATVRALVDLAPHLLAIHGQGEEAALVSPEEQRAWLDLAGGAAAAPLKQAVREAFASWREAADRLERLVGDQGLRAERLDLLRFQLSEIDGFGPKVGEEDELRREREVLRHAETILTSLDRARALLSEEEPTAVERISAAREALEVITGWEDEAPGWIEQLDEAMVRLDEVAMALARRLDQVELDPARLAGIEDRLVGLERLLRKHGGSSAEIVARATAMRQELDSLEADELDREGVERRAAEALARYQKAAESLSAARAAWAARLEQDVLAELADLALGRARFGVRLGVRARAGSPLERLGRAIDFGPEGFDVVELELAANPGEPLGPLAKVASGGELARIALALRLAARRESEGAGDLATATMVFDEVDSGVGGGEAAVLGHKLQRVAGGGQVLAVTHLPQVAAHGDAHVRVSKRVDGDRTFVTVEPLAFEERVEELARMTAGREVTALSRSHARELLLGSQRPGEQQIAGGARS